MPDEDVSIEFYTNDPKVKMVKVIVTTDLMRYRKIQNIAHRRGIARAPQPPARKIPVQTKAEKP